MAALIWANDQGRKVDILSIMPRMVNLAEVRPRLKRLGRSQAQLARHLKLDPSSLTKMLNGERKLLADEAAMIEDFFAAAEVEPLDVIPSTDTPERNRSLTTKVPIYGYAAAGGEERVAFNEGRIIDWIDSPPIGDRSAQLVGVRIIGSSMEPRLFAGELVIAQINLPPARDRDCLVEFHDGSALIKTYSGERDGHVFLHQWHPEKEISVPGSSVKAIHAVIWRR